MMSRSKSLLSLWLVPAVGLLYCVADTIALQNPRADFERRSSYFPLSVGNSWQYAVRDHSNMTGKTIKWSVTQREIIHGAPVYHLWQTPAQDDEPLSLSEVPGGLVEAGTERFLLKNPLHTGERWTAKSHSLRGKGVADAFEVISSGKACSIGERSFHDCATIREVDEANSVTSITTYARGVGPVKYVYFKAANSEEVDTTLTIKSWKVAGVPLSR